jgi:methyl-accepting chemotaxis protein
MQVKLNADLSATLETSTHTSRIKQALDQVTGNVMMADANYNIIYMNHSAIDMFSGNEQAFRKDLPDFDASQLIGTNIDIFHKDPAHQRKMLDGLDKTFKAEMLIGGRTMVIIATPVTDQNNTRTGTVVEWIDRTDEVGIQDEIETIISAVKAGELESRLEMQGKQDFFKQLSEGINELTDVVEATFNDVGNVMQAMSQGDLTNTITNEYQGVYDQCKTDINATIDKLGDVFGQVRDSAEFINNSSDEIASGNNNLSQRAEEQAASLEETASSMEQLTSTVKNNSDNAQQANQLANSARQLAERGGTVVNNAVQAMEEINDSSTKIAEIIGVIDEIAFQTNLLALNASVEAARAGEQGRGFSVVATEVRNLAQRSATAAKESKELIQNSLQKVRSGTEFVNETGKSLDEIVVGVKKVGDIIAEIAAASAEQSAGIEQVNQAVSQMDEITQQNAALAEQASAASVSMAEQSTNMVRILDFFKTNQSGKSQNKSAETKKATASQPPKQEVQASHQGPQSTAEQNTFVATDSDEWEEF